MFSENIIKNKSAEIIRITGKENFFTGNTTCAMYSYDSGLNKARPQAVINIKNRNQIQPLLKLFCDNNIPFIARGAGTNLSGGTIALKGAVILNLCALNKIIEIDTQNNYAVVEPGVVNLILQQELEKLGFFYAPDPASQKACTIGGNLGENAGGPRCLKYGVTVNNVLEAEIIMPNGEKVVWNEKDKGPDMLSLFIGSEGTLGIATKIKLKIIKKPPFVKTVLAGFNSIEESVKAVSDIIASGIVPCTIEALDKLTIEASEKHTKAGYPLNCEAVLLLEFSGEKDEVLHQEKTALEICEKNNKLCWKPAEDEITREKLWQGRKGAFAAMSRLNCNVSVEDGAVPRPKLAKAVKEIRRILKSYDLKAGLIFHAGDGNIHPNIILDERNAFETAKVKKAEKEILRKCVELGGTISGEHGIGVGKRFAMNWLFTSDELNIFKKIKTSFDPKNIANPDKIIPLSVVEDTQFIRPLFFKFTAPAKKIIAEISARHKTKTKTIIQGLKTKLEYPEQNKNAEILDVTKINRILKIDKENYTVAVEAGIKITDLHKKLKIKKLYAPLPNTEGTLGGLIAAKTYLPIRDHIIAMTVLFSDGKVCTYGTNTVKNVAGYDVSRFMTGSFGSYGIILNVALRLSAIDYSAHKLQPKSEFFKPNKYHINLKKELDKDNLLNPFIFEEYA